MNFSIVIPSLNAGAFLERALRSVLAQAGADTEVIVVDGGSIDGSAGLLAATAARVGGERFGEKGIFDHSVVEKKSVKARAQEAEGPLFHWCSEPDRGQSHALNKGFARATGRYLLWINADDLLLPGTLDRARAYLNAHPACPWLAGNLVYIDAQDRVLWCARDGQWRDRLYRHAPVRVYGPTSIFSRALFEQVGGFDESLHYVMDTDLWLRFKAAGARFHRLDHYCWAFRVHGGSKTAADLRGAADPHMLEERARMYDKNGLAVTRAGLWQQRAWRLLNGRYLRAWLDTRRMRGSKI